MADIKDQLIKDSYNYVLQSDLSTGVVYRIGGSIPVNPIFSSGLTINDSFVYSGAGEQNGYALLTDGTGYAYWGPVSGASGLTYYVQSTVPPGTGYTNGDRWFDTTTGDETVWINDGVGYGQWVQPNNGGGGGGSGLMGSGTTNYLTIWSSQNTLSASTIYFDGTNYNIPNLSAGTITSQNYQGNLVTDIQEGFGIDVDQSAGSVTITNTKPDVDVILNEGDGINIISTYPSFNISNTDRGSSQNIFKNITIDTNTQFSANDNNDTLNFSGIGVSITSDVTSKTLVFSAGTSSQSVSGDYLPLSGGTVTGNTTFTSGLTVNYIDFDTTPNVPSPTGGTLYFDSTENALSYKPITPSNDVTVNLGQESLVRFYNNLGFQINNGQALHITGATAGSPTVSLAVGTGGNAVQFQISGIATHDVPNLSYGFMTVFGVVRDVNLTGFTIGEQVYLSQTVPGGFSSYSGLSFTGRTCEVGHVLDNSVLGKLQVTILNEIEGTIITTQENNILSANNSSTGVFQFSGLSITTPSGTTFNVGEVEGWIIDNVTAPANPTIQLIIYSGATGIPATYVTSATETYILLTSGLTIVQQTTFPTPQQRRQNLYLGKFGHGNRQFLINAFNEPDSALSPVSQLRDMFTVIKLVNDGVIASANGANLNINTSAGVLYGLGIGYVTNKLNPNSLTVNGQSPATFQYRTQTGGTASNTTLIDPLNYDVGGVITPITGTKATNQRIYLLQNGQIRVQYGQQEYNQLAAAVAALQNEVFVTFPNFRDNGILIGVLSILSTCTQLNDTSKAQFFSVSKFGELIGAAGGTSTTTLQQAYNNSGEPEILINSTLDGLSIQNGTGNADNVTQLLQGRNTAGDLTSFIRADGAFSGTSIFGTGLTATTISAATYYNLPVSGLTGGSNIGITNNNNNFTISYTGSTGVSGNFLPLSGGTVTGGTVFQSGLTANTLTVTQSAITFSNLSSSTNYRTLVVNNLGQVTQFQNSIGLTPGSDPQVQSDIIKINKNIRYGSDYDVYTVKAVINIPGGNNTYSNFIGRITNNTSTTFIPSATSGLVDANDPTFIQVQSSLTVGALVYDETLLFAAPISLITVNYDNTLTTSNEFYIFLIAANTNNFSCRVWVDYEFIVPAGDNITFSN